MFSLEFLVILCIVGWSLVIIPWIWTLVDRWRDVWRTDGYIPIANCDIEDSGQENEIMLLKHFRNSVSAVIQLAEISPELKDFMRNRDIKVKSESFRKTVKRKASIPKIKGNLSRKNSSSHIGQQKGASAILKKMIDRSFCLAEHIHEWSLSQIGKVRFVDHAPLVFNLIRQKFGYSCKSILSSLDKPLKMFDSEGKSDSMFFITEDGRFLFKTLRGSEPNNVKAFLQEYFVHICKEPNTLLPRLLGFFTFEKLSRVSESTIGSTSNRIQEIGLLPKFTVLMMANVFSDIDIPFKFDFKGSQLGRETLGPHASLELPIHSTLKELDFLRLVSNNGLNRLNLPPSKKAQFLRQLSKDLELLKNCGFIDYSLLVGIHQHHKSTRSSAESSSSGSSSPKSDINAKSSILDSKILSSAWKLWAKSPSHFSSDFSDGNSMWIDEHDDLLEANVFGGIRSNDLNGQIDYEKYNMAKWFERGIKKQKPQFFGRDSPSISQIFTSPVGQPVQEGKTYPSPVGSPPEVGNKERDSVMSWMSNSSDILSGTGEPSVEEPIRYSTRLYEFVESIFV